MSPAAGHPPVLCGRDIRKAFRRDTGDVVQALDGVSLDIGHGTLAALIGPDGAGKTTLLRLVAGLMVVDAGILRVLGIDIAADPIFRHLIVFVPEGKDFCAVEPVTNMNDGLNRMDGETDHGVFVLTPGETRRGTVRFRLDRM